MTIFKCQIKNGVEPLNIILENKSDWKCTVLRHSFAPPFWP